MPRLVALEVSGPPAPWAAAGFAVAGDEVRLGGHRLHLARGAPRGLTGWTLSGGAGPADLDGVPTAWSKAPEEPAGAHPNGAVGIDHVVLATPDLARTEAALGRVGLERRRLREAGEMVQAFYRLGPVILEVVARAGEAGDGPASLWGFTVVVEDLDGLAGRLGHRLGPVKDAVQPGRRIATVRREAGLGVPLAFMTPEGLTR